MLKLTFYGGVREIGGNKIFLEDDNGKLFLDFGYPYSKYRAYYEEYLKPRAGAGLLWRRGICGSSSAEPSIIANLKI
jgi:hypothetical protein